MKHLRDFISESVFQGIEESISHGIDESIFSQTGLGNKAVIDSLCDDINKNIISRLGTTSRKILPEPRVAYRVCDDKMMIIPHYVYTKYVDKENTDIDSIISHIEDDSNGDYYGVYLNIDDNKKGITDLYPERYINICDALIFIRCTSPIKFPKLTMRRRMPLRCMFFDCSDAFVASVLDVVENAECSKCNIYLQGKYGNITINANPNIYSITGDGPARTHINHLIVKGEASRNNDNNMINITNLRADVMDLSGLNVKGKSLRFSLISTDDLSFDHNISRAWMTDSRIKNLQEIMNKLSIDKYDVDITTKRRSSVDVEYVDRFGNKIGNDGYVIAISYDSGRFGKFNERLVMCEIEKTGAMVRVKPMVDDASKTLFANSNVIYISKEQFNKYYKDKNDDFTPQAGEAFIFVDNAVVKAARADKIKSAPITGSHVYFDGSHKASKKIIAMPVELMKEIGIMK